MDSERQVKQINDDFKLQIQEWKNFLLRGDEFADQQNYWRAFEEQEQRVRSQAQTLPHSEQADTELQAVRILAHAGQEEQQKCIDAGMDLVLTKPLTQQTLKFALDAEVLTG